MTIIQHSKPAWVSDSDPSSEVSMDLRRYLRHGMEPLPDIEAVLQELRPCQVFHLRTEREPILLYPMFMRMNFERFSNGSADGWDVYLRKCPAGKV
ncbi:MAG TPA: hypothetical protein VHE12_12240 [bacterium]|nr:hypothetical protein [bacterium]